MGVPAFFRWLSRKYPSVVVHCVEQKPVDVNGVKIPIDSSEPNPNGVEFDNLYLDMNGIIHPCTHPEDRPAPRNEDEMMVAIFECIDRLFRIVRPRKLLYMAIDGVAPRAKMNQQRSRRFRASKETVEKINEVNRVRAELLLKGANLPPEKPKEEHFDSNCITPGTPFMARLSECLHYYIHDRLNSDPGWKGIKVILSDANVPGEGEHKIMDYIRKQRAQPDHDPNTQHCLCGADADLIMLGLATHEPNFTIIREEFKPNKPRPCDICGQTGHEIKDCIGTASEVQDVQTFSSEQDFIFVRLCVLREYLERELVMSNLPFKYEFERALDDWVFMCFFVGNDFLPHLPSLEIREGAIDRLIGLYKDAVYKTGGWLTNSGEVNLDRVQLIMNELGKVEDEIFKKRQQNELAFKAREKAKKRRMEFNEFRPDWRLVNNTQFAPKKVEEFAPVANARQEAFNIRKAGMHTSAVSQREGIQALLKTDNEPSRWNNQQDRRGVKRPLEDDNEDDDQAHDEVRLWEDGFKDRYYESKFDVGSDQMDFRYSVALHYIRGLCWVLKYYYQGCASWKWYFPYHYAPFASDFVNIAGLSTDFEADTQPFRPLEQLMGVFPAASKKHIPLPWTELMTDPESPIIDFYPEDFKIDLNGKKFAWQGVALLPFVDEKRLFKALKPYYNKLTPQEIQRNIRGEDRLYIPVRNPSYDFVKGLYQQKVTIDVESAFAYEGVQGTVLITERCVNVGGDLRSPVKGLSTIMQNNVVCVNFRDPKYPRGFVFPAKRLNGAKAPDRVLKPQGMDEESSRNWRPVIGMVPSNKRVTVDTAGHRMLGHYARQGRGPGRGQYSNVPPPPSSSSSRDYRNSRGHQQGFRQFNQKYDVHQNQASLYNYVSNVYSPSGSNDSRPQNYRGNMGNRDGDRYGSNRPHPNNYQSSNYNPGNYRKNDGGRSRNEEDPPRQQGPYRDSYQSSNSTNRYSYRR